MKLLKQILIWIVLGAAFGTFTGILSRKLGYGGLTGGVLAGVIAAPSVTFFVLLGGYWDDLIRWTVAGMVLGAALIALLGGITKTTAETVGLALNLTSNRILSGAVFGAIFMTWLGAGWSVFRGETTGLIGLLGSVIAGAFAGAFVLIIGRMLGDLVGGKALAVTFLDSIHVWRLEETLAGIPVGIISGVVAARFLLRQNV